VLNTGSSIPEAELEKIFEPFYRLEKSRNRNTGGSGLGLYIVKQILDIHSFPYRLSNEENGVLFTIHFPLPEQND
jgi:two-component system, OmpR family, sensor histidine kinase VanS